MRMRSARRRHATWSSPAAAKSASRAFSSLGCAKRRMESPVQRRDKTGVQAGLLYSRVHLGVNAHQPRFTVGLSNRAVVAETQHVFHLIFFALPGVSQTAQNQPDTPGSQPARRRAGETHHA